jgi:putative addiction module component (TIGR02574 family)
VSPAFEALLDQALQLGEEERGELAARLLRSLEPDDEDVLTPSEWEAAWAAEIDRRVREVREGTVELLDGDEVMAELREIARRS